MEECPLEGKSEDSFQRWGYDRRNSLDPVCIVSIDQIN